MMHQLWDWKKVFHVNHFRSALCLKAAGVKSAPTQRHLQLLEQELWESHVRGCLMVQMVWALLNWAPQVVVTPPVTVSSSPAACCFRVSLPASVVDFWFLFQTSCWHCFVATVSVFLDFFPKSGRSCDLDPRPYLCHRKVFDLALKTVFSLSAELLQLSFMKACPLKLCYNHD